MLSGGGGRNTSPTSVLEAGQCGQHRTADAVYVHPTQDKIRAGSTSPYTGGNTLRLLDGPQHARDTRTPRTSSLFTYEEPVAGIYKSPHLRSVMARLGCECGSEL